MSSLTPRIQPKVIVIKRGSVRVQVSEAMNRNGGREYPQFVLTYHSGGKRIRKRFADKATANSEAVLVANQLAVGEHQALRLTAADRSCYLAAIKNLESIQLPLHVATAELVAARSLLPQGATLVQAVEFFARHHGHGRTRKNVGAVVAEFLDGRRKAGRSAVHIKDLSSRLTRFASAFECPMDTVNILEVDRFLERLNVQGRTRLNYLRHIGSLFRFAARRKYLPRETLDDLLSVDRPKVEEGEILIFSPEEIRELLETARPEMAPWLAIGAFAGLRSAELQRLDWSEVQLERGFIEVPASKAKTASRRLVPIVENLRAWLHPVSRPSGPVTIFANMSKQIDWLTAAVNQVRRDKADGRPPFVWKRNALRHSFVSYRLAQIQDVARVALEAGNSTGVIFRNYRELVTNSEAADWFGVVPRGFSVSARDTVPSP